MTTTRKPRAASRALLDRQVSEADLQAAVFDLAKRLNYWVYHVYDSRKSGPDKGFPDALLAREGRVLAFEFKRERGVVSLAQHEWIYHLSAGGQIECYILRPHDLSSGRIEAILKGTADRGAA